MPSQIIMNLQCYSLYLNKLNKTEPGIFIFCIISLLSKDPLYLEYLTHTCIKIGYFSKVNGNIEKQAKVMLIYTHPRFPPFLLYFRCKLGVTFARKCFCDEYSSIKCFHSLILLVYNEQQRHISTAIFCFTCYKYKKKSDFF